MLPGGEPSGGKVCSGCGDSVSCGDSVILRLGALVWGKNTSRPAEDGLAVGSFSAGSVPTKGANVGLEEGAVVLTVGPDEGNWVGPDDGVFVGRPEGEDVTAVGSPEANFVGESVRRLGRTDGAVVGLEVTVRDGRSEGGDGDGIWVWRKDGVADGDC